MAHPLRVQILQILAGRSSSPKDMAKELDQPIADVAYHTKVLLNADCVYLVDTQARRGATEHFYRAKVASGLGAQPWQGVPDSVRSSFAAEALESFNSQAVAALEAGTFEKREGSGITWMPLAVDREGWQELVEILRGIKPKVATLADKCATRRGNPDALFPVVVALAAFEFADSNSNDERHDG